MKTFCIGDLHFGIKNNSNFIDYQINELDKIFLEILKSDIKNVIFLGDIFDSRQNIDIHILYKVLKCFEKIEKLNIYMIAGNHDIYFKNKNEVNSLSTIFKKFPFQIIDLEPKEIMIDNKKCLLVPWISPETKEKCLEGINNTDAKYCFGHFAINGFQLAQGVKEINGLNQSIFKKFKKTISAHFHLKDDQKNIIFIGSFVQLDWTDYNDQKRIIKIDTDKNIFDDLFITDGIFEKIIINDTECLKNDYKNKILKIYLEKKLSPKELSIIDNIKENSLSCEIIDKTIILDSINDNIKNEDFLELLNEYLNEDNDINITYKKQIKEYIKKLYNKTLSNQI